MVQASADKNSIVNETKTNSINSQAGDSSKGDSQRGAEGAGNTNSTTAGTVSITPITLSTQNVPLVLRISYGKQPVICGEMWTLPNTRAYFWG